MMLSKCFFIDLEDAAISELLFDHSNQINSSDMSKMRSLDGWNPTILIALKHTNHQSRLVHSPIWSLNSSLVVKLNVGNEFNSPAVESSKLNVGLNGIVDAIKAEEVLSINVAALDDLSNTGYTMHDIHLITSQKTIYIKNITTNTHSLETTSTTLGKNFFIHFDLVDAKNTKIPRDEWW